MAAENLDIKGKTCLVTGGAGLIGSFIVKLLLEEHGCKVKIVDCLKESTHPSGKKPDWVPAEAEFIEGDASDRELMEKALQGVDVIFHQAGSGYEPVKKRAMERVFSDATMSTCIIFDIIKELQLPVKKVVTASSMAVYGEASYKRKDGTEFIPTGYRDSTRVAAGKYEVLDENGEECTRWAISETRQLIPPHPYHLAKFCQEKMTLAAGAELGISTTALRYSIVHGPHQSVHNPYTGVLSIFATRILNGKSPIIYEDGNQTRDFVFVEDIARANICVAQDARSAGEVYNVGTGRGGDTMSSVAEIICELLDEGAGVKPEYSGSFRVWDTRHMLLDPSKLMGLGWKPQVSLREGLKRHVTWVKETAAASGGIEDKFEKAYKDMLDKGAVLPSSKKQKVS